MADRVTIVPADGTVIVNGVARSGLTFTLADGIHAVQGYEDGHFEVEFSTVSFTIPGFPPQQLKPLNQLTTDATPFQVALDAWTAAGEE